MAKKNSNYVTEKTIQKNAAESKRKAAEKKKKQIKSIAIPVGIALLVIAALLAVIYIGGGFDYNPEATEHVAISLEGYNTTLHVELYGNDAPNTVKHFNTLVNNYYYVGKYLTAYEGGKLFFGPESKVNGIKGEFADNGVENKVPFKVGTLVMARGEEYDSAYGRFFVVTKDTDVSKLKGSYAAFGMITDGMDVIEEIVGKLNVGADGKIPTDQQVKILSISSHDSH